MSSRPSSGSPQAAELMPATYMLDSAEDMARLRAAHVAGQSHYFLKVCQPPPRA